MNEQRILIVGGGLLGLGCAYRIPERFPGAKVALLEKEPAVGRHQSGHNSGVLHSGLYYKPGSLKAKLAVEGIRQMVAFCQENGVAHEICGKIVVATEEEEVPRLNDLFARGQHNGLQGLRLLGRDEIREIEPHAAGIAAIRVPEEGIVNYHQVAAVLQSKIESQGNRVLTNAKVTGFRQTGSGWVVHSTAGDQECDLLVNCAGLHSDRVNALAGNQREVRIVPFRGEYYKIRSDRQYLVKHLIYPVPDPKFPFLGVHYTRMIEGGVECGPNAVLAFAREGYTKTDVNLGDLWDSLTFSGLWKFLQRYPRMCWDELRRSFSKRLFCLSLQRLVPEIREEDLVAGGAGVRAQAMSPNGELVQDFHFVEGFRSLHVVNAPSPGATSSLAIGREIVRRISSTFV